MTDRQIQRGLMPEFETNIRPRFADIIDHFPCNDHDFNKILSYLYQEAIIDFDEMEELEQLIKSKKARQLLKKLKDRGERAYRKFVEALKKYNFLGILKILEVGPDNRESRERLEWRILTKIEDKRYPKTRAFECGFSKLKKLGVLGIIGSAGDGKSILSRMIANDCKNHVPEIVTKPDDCQLRTLDDGQRYIMIIDDMLGKSSPSPEMIRRWEANFEKLKLLVDEGQLVIIYTMRDYVYNYTKYKLQKYDPFSNVEARIFLHKGELTLNVNERDEMMKFHGVLDDESKSLRNYPDFGFPAIVGNTKRQSVNPKYSSHLFFLKTELETFWKEDMRIYSALLLLYFMGEGDLSQEKSEVFVKAKETVKKLLGSFDESSAVDIWRELSESFVCVTEPDSYHEIFTLRGNVAQAFMLHLSERRLEMALENSPLDLLLSMTEVEKSCQMMSKVYVPTKYYPILAARFLSEITLNNLNVFRHPAFLKNEFLEILLNTDSDGILMTIKDIDLCTMDSKPDKGNIFHFIAKFCSAQSLDMFLRRRCHYAICFHTTSLGYNCCQLIANSDVECEKKLIVLKWRKLPRLASIGRKRTMGCF